MVESYLGLIDSGGEKLSGLGRARGGDQERRMSKFAVVEADYEG